MSVFATLEGNEMNRDDWATLALIGISALGGMTLTSVLYSRWFDAEAMEAEIFMETPVEVHWQHVAEKAPHPTPPASAIGSRIIEETLGENLWQRFGEKKLRSTSPTSYGLTLRSRGKILPLRDRFLTFDSKTWRETPDYVLTSRGGSTLRRGFVFKPIQMPTSEPSG